jgi:hypothetical protein
MDSGVCYLRRRLITRGVLTPARAGGHSEIGFGRSGLSNLGGEVTRTARSVSSVAEGHARPPATDKDGQIRRQGVWESDAHHECVRWSRAWAWGGWAFLPVPLRLSVALSCVSAHAQAHPLLSVMTTSVMTTSVMTTSVMTTSITNTSVTTSFIRDDHISDDHISDDRISNDHIRVMITHQ